LVRSAPLHAHLWFVCLFVGFTTPYVGLVRFGSLYIYYVHTTVPIYLYPFGVRFVRFLVYFTVLVYFPVWFIFVRTRSWLVDVCRLVVSLCVVPIVTFVMVRLVWLVLVRLGFRFVRTVRSFGLVWVPYQYGYGNNLPFTHTTLYTLPRTYAHLGPSLGSALPPCRRHGERTSWMDIPGLPSLPVPAYAALFLPVERFMLLPAARTDWM